MENITKVEHLIKKLENEDPKKYPQIIKTINIPKEEFDEYCFWEEEGYTRNCIARTKDFELILLCWKSGDKTPIHDHANQKCWVYQITGNVLEVRLKKSATGQLVQTNVAELKPGMLTYMDDNMGFHFIENESNQKAMTLHIYVSPIDECKVFDRKRKKFVSKKMSYNTISND